MTWDSKKQLLAVKFIERLCICAGWWKVSQSVVLPLPLPPPRVQFPLFAICAVKRHQILGRASEIEVTPQIGIARVEAASAPSQMCFHQSVATKYSIYSGLARMQVEPVTMMP